MINSAGIGKNLGLPIGMFICVAIGIALSELGGYNDATSGEILLWSIIFGSAIGLFLGRTLDRYHQKNNYKKAI